MNIALTPELECALIEKAEQQGTTPELMVLHDLLALYAPSSAGHTDGSILADFLASRAERTDSRNQNGGKMSSFSTDEDNFGEYLEEKRRLGRL